MNKLFEGAIIALSVIGFFALCVVSIQMAG